MGSFTTNYNIYKPDVREKGWGELVNTSFDSIDAAIKSNFDDLTSGSGTVIFNTVEINSTDNTTHISLLGDPANPSPTAGDLWWTGTNLNFYNGSINTNLLAGIGSGVLAPSGANTQIQYNDNGVFAGHPGLVTDKLGSLSCTDITASGTTTLYGAGTINEIVIGDVTPAAITGTTVGATTLTSTNINGTTITGTTITDGTVSINGGTVTGTWADIGSVTTADINGGTADDVTIGGATPAAVTGTTVTGTTLTDGTVSVNGGTVTGTWIDLGSVTTIDINGGTVDDVLIGNSTPASGKFTGISVSTAGGIAHINLSGDPTVSVPEDGDLWWTGTDLNFYNGSSTTNLISGGALTGELKLWSGTSLPTGYLWCDGSVASQATYADLYAIVSTSYNTGEEGVGNFRLPDLRGRLPLGQDDMGQGSANRVTDAQADLVGGVLGSEDHTLIEAELSSHTHDIEREMGTGTGGSIYQLNDGSSGEDNSGHLANSDGKSWVTYTDGTHGTRAKAVGSDTAHNNLQPSLTINYIIKT